MVNMNDPISVGEINVACWHYITLNQGHLQLYRSTRSVINRLKAVAQTCCEMSHLHCMYNIPVNQTGAYCNGISVTYTPAPTAPALAALQALHCGAPITNPLPCHMCTHCGAFQSLLTPVWAKEVGHFHLHWTHGGRLHDVLGTHVHTQSTHRPHTHRTCCYCWQYANFSYL